MAKRTNSGRYHKKSGYLIRTVIGTQQHYEKSLGGLRDLPRSGRPRKHNEEEDFISLCAFWAENESPGDMSFRSVEDLSTELQMGPPQIRKIWARRD